MKGAYIGAIFLLVLERGTAWYLGDGMPEGTTQAEMDEYWLYQSNDTPFNRFRQSIDGFYGY